MARLTFRIRLLAVYAALGGFLFGYDTASMSAALLQLKLNQSDSGISDNVDGLSDFEQELVTSFVVLGAFLSAVSAGWLNNWFGRRLVLLAGAAFFFIGEIWQASSQRLGSMLAARIVLGLGVGISSHTVPLFLSECAPPELRGVLCFTNDMMIVVGQMTAACISTGLFYGEVRNGWRYILGAGSLPALSMFLGFWNFPDSPRWLLSKGRKEEALKVLKWLREGSGCDAAAVSAEFDMMNAGAAAERRRAEVHGDESVALLGESGAVQRRKRGALSAAIDTYVRDARVRRALLIGCGLQLLQQWSGINTIMYYGATLLNKAGFSCDGASSDDDLDPFSDEHKSNVAYTILFAAAQALGVLASTALVDRTGRRRLLIVSLVGVAIALFSVGAVFAQPSVVKGWAVGLIIMYLLCFGFGLSPVPWTVNAEIYPTHVRATCISLSTATNWLNNFVVSQTFLSLAKTLSTYPDCRYGHPDGVFWFYGGVAAVGIAVVPVIFRRRLASALAIPSSCLISSCCFLAPRPAHAPHAISYRARTRLSQSRVMHGPS